MARKKPIVLPLAGTSNTDGDLTLKTRPMEPGKLLCVQLVSVLNDDTANCLAHIGFERAGLQVWVETILMSTATRTYNYYHPVWVPSDYRVVVKFEDAGDSKLCKAWVYGYLASDAEE
jgi:hypothetical protein